MTVGDRNGRRLSVTADGPAGAHVTLTRRTSPPRRTAPRKTAKKAAPAPETAQSAAGEPTSTPAGGSAADAGTDAAAAISVGRPPEAEQPSMHETAERGAELTAEQVSGGEETAAPG